ncbi:hypothetical protein DFJ77DRAFT_442794 [Powellomyces hirtus]|nr:hypothetical protein DFJ77DRAFT_442794 [Powellomyces hirtus]
MAGQPHDQTPLLQSSSDDSTNTGTSGNSESNGERDREGIRSLNKEVKRRQRWLSFQSWFFAVFALAPPVIDFGAHIIAVLFATGSTGQIFFATLGASCAGLTSIRHRFQEASRVRTWTIGTKFESPFAKARYSLQMVIPFFEVSTRIASVPALIYPANFTNFISVE